MLALEQCAFQDMREYADLRSFQDGRMALEAVDTFVITLELVYRELIAREQLHGFNADVAEACDFVTQSLNFLRRYQDEQLPTHESHIPPLLHTGCVGRPKCVSFLVLRLNI